MEDKNNPSKPRVTLFGQDLDAPKSQEKDREEGVQKNRRHSGCGHYGRSHSCGSGVWGFALLISGVILLMNTTGLISWQVWQFIWPFWPTLLIILGISIFLGRNAFSRLISSLLALGVITVIFIFALMKAESPITGYLPQWAKDFVSSLNINTNNR
jgi:hypothetical protein